MKKTKPKNNHNCGRPTDNLPCYSSVALFTYCVAHWWSKFKTNFNVFVHFQLIKTAEEWAIRSSHKGEYVQIVLCTCSAAGSKRIKETCNNVFQCIVDECGMCLEPETLIPIVSSKAKQVVLIGDHKQLQPIVTNRVGKVAWPENINVRAILRACIIAWRAIQNGKLVDVCLIEIQA